MNKSRTPKPPAKPQSAKRSAPDSASSSARPIRESRMSPMFPKRPRLPDGMVQNVPLGTARGFRAGAYVNRDINTTFQIEGDNDAVFRILRVETDDVVFIDDPDLPPGHQHVQVLETALKVEGPGPIEI